MFDYHIHTNHSSDSKSSMESMIRAAYNAGLKEISITDHADFSFPKQEFLNLDFDLDAYINEIGHLRQKYADKICVLAGIEMGIRDDLAQKIGDIAKSYDFDIIIGSLHDFEGLDFGMDFDYGSFFAGRDKNTAYGQYFEILLDSVAAVNDFDILGHMDYIERYAPYPNRILKYANHAEIIDEILKILIGKGKGIEINTAGYAYGLNHSHPQIEIVRAYRRLGGEIITIGSDAHNPQRIGADFDKAIDMLKAVGFKYITKFRNRIPEMVAL
ncbi:MAG: histidinol-phosphatase HisJ family protein [Defluviitaleaceae bacterium]|nr:histidinol-phosphatase HisJ family protein [Defluviitaleaceae bacterium]